MPSSRNLTTFCLGSCGYNCGRDWSSTSGNNHDVSNLWPWPWPWIVNFGYPVSRKNELCGRIVVRLDIRYPAGYLVEYKRYPVKLEKALSGGRISSPTLTFTLDFDYIDHDHHLILTDLDLSRQLCILILTSNFNLHLQCVPLHYLSEIYYAKYYGKGGDSQLGKKIKIKTYLSGKIESQKRGGTKWLECTIYIPALSWPWTDWFGLAQLSYDDSTGEEGFWCHEESPLIHPAGRKFYIYF